MTTSEFYASSLVEVIAAIESHKRREKTKIEKIFLLADLYANRLAHSFDPKKVKLAQPWDVYPDAFAEEQKAHEEAWKQEELERYKEGRRRAMDAHNAKNRREQEVIE
ncbi:MAG: hypothetical protein K2N01_12715 [Lachnospiraceae bacterium]|nr:hypothetical protein [Lachnospiraceae bacterium]